MEPAPDPQPSGPPPVVYPDSDGEPMADNAEQYDLMVPLKDNLDLLFPAAFVAANLFWYPVEGHPEIRYAPDVMVAFGRPKGRRSSYRMWDEGGVAPQVVFEIWSPRNTFPEQVKKLRFYEKYGVREFYLFDIDREQFSAWVAEGGTLEPVDVEHGWTSPLLGIRMQPAGRELKVYTPNGEPFLTTVDRQRKLEAAQAKALAAEAEASAERAAREALLAKLRAAGIDPDAI